MTVDAGLTEASHASHRVIGRKGAVHESPRPDDAVFQRRGGVELDADLVGLAEAAEIIEAQRGRRARWARQTGE